MKTNHGTRVGVKWIDCSLLRPSRLSISASRNAGVGCSKRYSQEEGSGCCIKTNLTWASLLSHSNSRTPFVCFLPCLLAIVLRLSNFFSHAMIGRRRRRWRVIKLRSRSVDRQHRFGLKRDSGGVGEAILMCWGSPLPPPPSSSRRPRPPNVSECRSPEVPLAGGGGGGGSVGVCATAAAADRLTMTIGVMSRRLLAAAAASVAAVGSAATGSRFRRRPPARALGASVCRTGAAFSDLQSRGKHEAAARSTEATDGRTVWWRREEG